MVDWLAGNRVRGTSTERTSTTGFNEGTPYTGVGGWKEVARTTLGSAGDLISVASLSDKRYYMVLTDKKASGDTIPNYRLNNDSGSNYSQRVSTNGAADGTAVSQTEANGLDPYNANNSFNVQYISNLAGKEKLAQGHFSNRNATGSGNDPRRSEFVWKWANTSDAINRIDVVNPSSGSFDTGSECVVLGWDDTDTHTTNFWEELASVDLSGGTSETLDSGTFTAKKYLWVQMFFESSGGTIEPDMTFNSDTGNTYAERYNINGGSDVTSASRANLRIAGLAVSGFVNWFIVNNSANEKLVISNLIYNTSTGAGTSPSRREMVGKWTNTSSQITKIVATDAGAGTLGTNTIMKVWGSN